MLFPIEEEDGPRARRALKAQLYDEFVARLYSAAQQRCYGLIDAPPLDVPSLAALARSERLDELLASAHNGLSEADFSTKLTTRVSTTSRPIHSIAALSSIATLSSSGSSSFVSDF